jgi:hypothetical protein
LSIKKARRRKSSVSFVFPADDSLHKQGVDTSVSMWTSTCPRMKKAYVKNTYPVEIKEVVRFLGFSKNFSPSFFSQKKPEKR